MNIQEYAAKLSIQTCLEFDPGILIPEDRIRAFCIDNKCGSYGKNYMCPPRVGTIDELALRIGNYSHALLLQYVEELEVTKENSKEVARTKSSFHKAVLELETFLRGQSINDIWGMIGGSCGICEHCQAIDGEDPCLYPDRARMSLEAIGVDVLGLLDTLGLDSGFHEDRITWTGCILYNESEVVA